MNRVERISAILIQLQSKRVVTAKEIADRFDISLRTVYRDLKALEQTGVPIYGEPGIGFSLEDGYNLPPVHFTREEAATFITAGKLIDKLTDEGLSTDYHLALQKIKATLKQAQKELANTLDSRIQVVQSPQISASNQDRKLNKIILAVADKLCVQMEYTSADLQTETRMVEPVGMYLLGSRWYLIAYCWLRKDYRKFRLDRMQKIRVAFEQIQEQVHPPLDDFLRELTRESELRKVVISVETGVYKYLGDQKFYHGFVSEQQLENRMHMTFLTSSMEGMARWFITFADFGRVEESEDLKIRLREIVEKIKKVHG